MARLVDKRLSQKSVEKDDIVTAYNRELIPTVNEIRERLNESLSEGVPEHSVRLWMTTLQTPAPSSTYVELNAHAFGAGAPLWFPWVVFDPTEFPEESGVGDRTIRWEVVGFGTGGSSTVRFQLYNGTDGEAIEGSELVAPNGVGILLSDPLPVGDDPGQIKLAPKQYEVQGRDDDGTTYAVYVSARIIVKYEEEE